jgi:plastocyanin
MAAWSIKIVPGAKPTDPAQFVPQNQPSSPGGTLYADAGDAVSWNNTTTHDHQPVQGTTANGSDPFTLGTLIWDPVTPGHQTSAWIVTGNPGTVITYICQIHPNETGTITVTGAPATKSPNN